MRVRDDAPALAPAVLVIEDEPAVRAFAVHALRRVGVRALDAPTGDRALQVLAAESVVPAVVLLDLSMPGRSAASTLAALRARLPDLPVVLTSGYTEREARERVGGDVDGYLQKPYSSADLRAALAPFLALDAGA